MKKMITIFCIPVDIYQHINKTDRHNIPERLLKVVLNTINLTATLFTSIFSGDVQEYTCNRLTTFVL